MTDQPRGTLYGIGVGPGDPGLLTLRAVEILRSVQVVFAARSTKNRYSLALNVAKKHLAPSVRVVPLGFPMTRDEDVLERAWRANARRVLDVLEEGVDAAFVSIGDPLTYSTYGYLLSALLEMDPDLRVETVPGVTAYHAAAARLNLSLVESAGSLLVVSGVNDIDEIERLLTHGDTVVIMKTYRNYDLIVEALSKLPSGTRTYAVSSCGLPEERILEDAGRLQGEKMPYLSLVIVKGTGEER
jgi:precorrin-2/cobalt-factor-2 C20-methyltransferase